MEIKLGMGVFNLVLLLSITSCSTFSYKEPKSGPVARVRFVTNSTSITVVRAYDSSRCEEENEMMRLRNGFFLFSSPKKLGIPLNNFHDNAAKEVLVKAGGPEAYMFEDAESYGTTSVKCGVVVKQLFEEGKDYELSYDFNNANCFLDVYEISKDKAGSAQRVLLQRRDKRMTSDFSAACVDKFNKIRLY